MIGVLGVQGAIEEHVSVLSSLVGKENVRVVRTPEELASVDALVIPGGESTTIARLLVKTGLFRDIQKRGRKGFPIMGTCAGMVVLASEGCGQVKMTGQRLLGLMDVQVERNAFGRQKDSFETELHVPALGKKPFPCVFIRAPAITRTLSKEVEVLASYRGMTIAAKQGNMLALSFHPELSGDARFHEYFLAIDSQ